MEIRFRQPQGYDSAPEMHYDSKAKGAVLMKMDGYSDHQRDVLQKLREKGNYVEVKDAIIMIEPEGICLVAANPNRPSILVFGDAPDKKSATSAAKKYRHFVEKELQRKGILYREDDNK